MEIEQGKASCDSREALERLSEFENKEDLADDSLVQRGKA